MDQIALLPIALGAAAFFLVGALWYGVLFSRSWQRASGLSDEALAHGNLPLIFGLTYAFEALIALVLAHQIAMTDPSDRAIMMIAIGFGAFVMTPAIGIVYLYLRKPFTLFAIDAGHFVVGMTAMGAVFVVLR